MVFKQSNEQSFTKDYNVDTEKTLCSCICLTATHVYHILNMRAGCMTIDIHLYMIRGTFTRIMIYRGAGGGMYLHLNN